MASENVNPLDTDVNQGDEVSVVSNLQKPSANDRGRQNSQVVSVNGEIPIKIVGPNNEEIVPEDFVVAPDGGWGWVVVFAAFMSNLITDGTLFSVGIVTQNIATSTGLNGTALDEMKAKLSWVGGMLAGFQLVAGPFVSSLSNIFGFRITAIAGSVTAFFGFFMAWLFNQNGPTEPPHLPSLYGFVGFVGGIGLCCMYLPAIITVGYYFDKRRALATGIALCGSGVGTFVYAPVVTFLIEKFKWPITIMVESFFLLSSILFVSLYRPLKPVKQLTPPDGKGEIKSIHEPATENRSLADLSKQGESENSGLLLSDNDVANVPKEGAEQSTGDNQPYSAGQSALSVGSGLDEDQILSQPHFPSFSSSTESARSARSYAPTITLLVNPSDIDIGIGESRIFQVASTATLNKPLHQPDIFYIGSLHHVNSSESLPSIELEAVPVNIAAESRVVVAHPSKKQCCKFCAFTFPVLRRMLDFSLFKSFSFVILAMSGAITFMGFFVPYAYITELAKQRNKGLDDFAATALVSIIGVSNIIGRVFCGIVGNRMPNRVLLINNVAVTVMGLSTALIPFIKNSYAGFVVYAFVFGFSIACFISLRSILVVQLMGISKLTNAFGLLCLFHGMAAFVGGPLAGYLSGITKNYNLSFHVAGALVVFSALMCYPLNIINNWEKKRPREKELIKVQVV